MSSPLALAERSNAGSAANSIATAATRRESPTPAFAVGVETPSDTSAGRSAEDHFARRGAGGIPIANLVYSAVEGSQRAMLEAFLHQVKTYAKRRSEAARAGGSDEPPRDKGLLARLWLGG